LPPIAGSQIRLILQTFSREWSVLRLVHSDVNRYCSAWARRRVFNNSKSQSGGSPGKDSVIARVGIGICELRIPVSTEAASDQRHIVSFHNPAWSRPAQTRDRCPYQSDQANKTSKKCKFEQKLQFASPETV
jgi:hypothetical protein